MEEKHLPLFGIGPLYVAIIIALTAAGIVLSECGIIGGKFQPLRVYMLASGIVLIVSGLWMWIHSVVFSKIDKNISENHLVTSGAYAHTRNPLYAAFAFICTGAILIEGNLWLMLLPNAFVIILALMMKRTEEKWLTELYGDEYTRYAERVPRCVPTVREASPVRHYKSNIPTGLWWILDIFGNIGWIIYLTGLVKLLSTPAWNPLPVVLEVISAIGILAGLTEIITERIDRLDRMLPAIRLRRGFGTMILSCLAGALVSGIHLCLVGESWPLLLMTAGAVLCLLCAGAICLKYKPQ